MSIASQIEALQADKAAIRQAILAKGGSSASGNGFDDFATDIGTIQTGITPSGKLNITDTTVKNVTQYAQAQIVDANLVAANIAKGVTVLGITGTHEGGGIAEVQVIHNNPSQAKEFAGTIVNNGELQTIDTSAVSQFPSKICKNTMFYAYGRTSVTVTGATYLGNSRWFATSDVIQLTYSGGID